MSVHHGKIVEHCIRNLGINISDLARNMSVDRKTVYNWFKQVSLSKELVKQIGIHISHDFADQLPELFSADDLQPGYVKTTPGASVVNLNVSGYHDWQGKYISLLEKHTKLLEGLSEIQNKKAVNQ
ncbi:hypothetical protein [Mucilaginibacter sp. CSA2-8R]|uniref:hypothetical protein n=1 Tax=Mucilaginibacter sp. CSA2-8R TaxID=3141542 RepID=UPI00315D8AEF